MKILIGTVNIASVLGEMKVSFEKLGHQVTLMVNEEPGRLTATIQYDVISSQLLPQLFRTNLFEGTQSTILKALRKPFSDFRKYLIASVNKKMLPQLIEEHDLFIFVWSSILPNYADLKAIKAAGKKIVFIFVGDDVRWYWAMKQEFESLEMLPIDYGKTYNYGPFGLYRRLKRIRMAERYADIIYSKREQAQLQKKPFYHWIMFVNSADYKSSNRNITKPLIIHAPSNSKIKGTSYVLDAVAALKKEGLEFDFKLIQQMPFDEAKNWIEKSDIAIDQLLIPGGGRFCTECMATGSAVISYMNYENYYQGFEAQKKETCPIIDANVTNIKEVLKDTILKYSTSKEDSLKSVQYVHENLEVLDFCQRLIKRLDSNCEEYDFNPVFYDESFIPENFIARALYKGMG